MLNMIGRMIYLWVPVLKSLYQIKWENQKWFEALNTFLFQRLDNVSTIIIHSTTINDACSNGKSTEYQTNSKKKFCIKLSISYTIKTESNCTLKSLRRLCGQQTNYQIYP